MSTDTTSPNVTLSPDTSVRVARHSPYSRSDEYEDERLSGKHQSPTLNNATYIDVGDLGFRRRANKEQIEKYRRLELYNQGTHNRKWRRNQSQLHDEDDWYFCQALTAQMGLSEKGRLLTWRGFKSMDVRTYRGLEDENTEDLTIHTPGFIHSAVTYFGDLTIR